MQAHDAPPTRALLLILLLWLAGVLAAGQFAKIAALLPHVISAYSGYGAKIGFLVSTLSVVGVIFGALVGLILAQIGFRALLICALVLGGALSMAQALMLPFGLFLISRFLEGISHLVIVVAAPTMIAQIAPPHLKSAAMTLWSTMFAVSFALFSWGVMPMVPRLGLPAVFMLHGVLMLVMAAVMWRILPRIKTANAATFPRLSQIFAVHRRAYSSPHIIAPAAGWLFYATSFVALVAVLPGFIDAPQRNFVAGAMPLAALIMSLLLGVFLLNRFHPVTVLVTGFATASLFALLLLSGVYVAGAAIGMLAAMGLIQAGSFAAVPALNAEVDDQALANGAMAQLGNLGNLIGTPLLLLLVGYFGLKGLVGFAVTAFACGIVIHVLLHQSRQAAPR